MPSSSHLSHTRKHTLIKPHIPTLTTPFPNSVEPVMESGKVASHLTLRWGDYFGLLWWAQSFHNGLEKWKRKGEGPDNRLLHEKDSCPWCGFEMEEDSQKERRKKQGGFWKPKKARKQISPQSLKGKQPYWHFDFSPVRPVSDFHPTELGDNAVTSF